MLKLRFDRYIRQLCNMFNFQIYIYYIENRQLFFRKQVDNHTADNIESLPGAVTRIARKRDKKHACAHDLGFQHSRSQSFDPFGQRQGSIGRYFMYGTYIVLILPTYLPSLFLFGPLLPCSSVLCYLLALGQLRTIKNSWSKRARHKY